MDEITRVIYMKSASPSLFSLPLGLRSSAISGGCNSFNTGSVFVAKAIMVRHLSHRSKLHTLTFDNGKEFADHAIIDEFLGSSSYLAHPYSSWERGLNENTNGLIRQFFPKGTDFDRITESQIEVPIQTDRVKFLH